MSHTKMFKKLEHNFVKEYGTKGEGYAYGYAHKHGIKIDRR